MYGRYNLLQTQNPLKHGGGRASHRNEGELSFHEI